MGHRDRVEQTNALIRILGAGLWELPRIRERLVHVDYGAEHIVPEDVHALIRFTHTATTRHIRFAPDFFVVDREDQERTYLLEYKCTLRPLYSEGRIGMLREKSPRDDLDWPDIGQWEAQAYDNYRALAGLGVRVAILNYSAYHERLLLCDFVSRVASLHRDRVRFPTRRGSRTPFINFDYADMRSLEEFLAEEHGFDVEELAAILTPVRRELRSVLPVDHHPNSSLS